MASTSEMVAVATDRLGKLHRQQVHRDPWPDFEAFDPTRYDRALRRGAAIQWAGRARAEHESIHQFTVLSHALCEARVPLQLQGSLARLITDEVRHAELCAEAAETVFPEGYETEPAIFRWETPKLPWGRPPLDAGTDALLRWAARAVLTACCFGETLSRPMLDAIAVVATDPMAEAIARQILRDEHLHATFGWEALSYLLPRLDEEGRDELASIIPRRFTEFQRSTCCGIDIHEVAGSVITIERTGEPNLGTLTDHQYAMIFFATVEQEIIPNLQRLGFDAEAAWARRPAL